MLFSTIYFKLVQFVKKDYQISENSNSDLNNIDANDSFWKKDDKEELNVNFEGTSLIQPHDIKEIEITKQNDKILENTNINLSRI